MKFVSSKTIKIIILGIVVLVSFILIFAFKDKDKNKRIENETTTKLFKELKKNHPEFSTSQLKFYREIAENNKEIIKQCRGRDDENDCIASVAFLKGQNALCGLIENTKMRIECASVILERLGIEKIDKCWSFNDHDLIHCLRNVFATYDKPEDCLNLKVEKTQQVCESIFYYETAFFQYNRELCKKITNERINQLCFKILVD